MRVLEITGEPILHGGQERFISNLIEFLDDPNIAMDVLTPYHCDNEAFANLVKNRGGNVYEMKLQFEPGKSRKPVYKTIKEFLSKHVYDVVHIHSGSISVLAYAAAAAKRARIKKIIVHSHCTATQSIKHTLVKAAFGRIIANNATDFWACSLDAGRDKYCKSIVENNLIVIPNGIKIDAYRHDNTKRQSIRRQYNMQDGDFVIGHVGRFSYQKNHEMLMEIFSIIKENHKGSKLLLVGDGELLKDIKQRVSDENLADDVVFSGNVDNVADYYQAMDCFVFPSRFEGFGYVVLEAQAAGLPCLISSEVPEDVVVGDNVEILPLSDVNVWANCALNYTERPLADNIVAIKKAGYDVHRTAKVVRTYYTEV